MTALKENYRIKDNWTGGKYIGITLNWDYVRCQVRLSMPGYNEAALRQFGHKKPSKRQDSLQASAPITYGAKQQFAPDGDSSLLSTKRNNG